MTGSDGHIKQLVSEPLRSLSGQPRDRTSSEGRVAVDAGEQGSVVIIEVKVILAEGPRSYVSQSLRSLVLVE